MRKKASQFNISQLEEDTARQLKLITFSTQLKNATELKQKEALAAEMNTIYSTAKVGNNSLMPHLVRLMANSRDYNELLHSWWGWRNESGRKMRQIYKEYIGLTNKGAKENGYTDRGEAWRLAYEVDNFATLVEQLWKELKPFYIEIHAYVRYKLAKAYPGKVSEKDYIEAHLLGNMWAQNWVNIFDIVMPYENKSNLDVTSNLKLDSRYNTPKNLTRLAESFFVSLGLKELPQSFYEKSMLQKPKDREVVCHASAWDFNLYKDVRIKQCVEITHNHLVTLHHELGHVQYFLQYWDLPGVYRTGVNPGFHEAVGDLMSLSVDTTTHLEILGLLKNYTSDEESDINVLMKMALRKIAFLPFGYLIDQWRWKVFSGEISERSYNVKWWNLRKKFQGIKPPVPRSEDDFDPGAKFHIPKDVPYIRYFVSAILQFQFHKAACDAAQFKGPLFKCSIYKSKEAGEKIAAMLAMGKSKPWPHALEKMTGSKEMSVAPIKEYFQPLQDWLVKERCSKKYYIGWPGQPADGAKECKTSTAEPTIQENSGRALQNCFPSFLLTLTGLLHLVAWM
ncbi:angiotensin-converting enzyme-like [Dendronephthya gigantea]|uniref:angiotensin-converting enzyme-like n=1 Tax=Dendronephthya gigantea TaxID=151771 RepID=UPI00106BA36D|nr:angiotensin-converting enzyme-like [Dendronephthya gigantea]